MSNPSNQDTKKQDKFADNVILALALAGLFVALLGLYQTGGTLYMAFTACSLGLIKLAFAYRNDN